MAIKNDGSVQVPLSDFLKGGGQIPAHSMSYAEWASIVQDAVNDLDIPQSAHQLDSLKAMFTHEDEVSALGTSQSLNLRALTDVLKEKDRQLIPTDGKYVALHETGPALPTNWYMASKEGLKPITRHYLLLSTRKKFLIVVITWAPHEEWDDEGMSSRPIRFWYEAERLFVREANLKQYIAEADMWPSLRSQATHPGLSILGRIHNFTSYVGADLEAAARAGKKRTGRHMQRINRIAP
jgi:hypothetical protein